MTDKHGYLNDEIELIKCEQCIGGRLALECCNGANGCSCKGEVVDMGDCNVCGGSGWHRQDTDTLSNIKAIQGRCFIGSGPTRGYWMDK